MIHFYRKKLTALRFSFLLMAGLGLIISLASSGCGTNDIISYEPINGSGGDEYKTYVTPEDADTPFSFEYPSYSYNPIIYEPPQPGLPITILHIHPISFEGWSEGVFVNIEIWITPIDGDFPDAETALEEHLSLYEDKPGSYLDGIEPDSLVIKKHRVIVAGAEGWETIISYKEKPIPILPNTPTPRANTSIVERELFFDCNGMMWNIELYSDAASYEQFRYDFEHLLGTFKIID